MPVSRLSPRRRALLLVGLAALAVAILLATGFCLELMMVLPALATATLLLAWPYPGLELIMRIARRRVPRPRRARAERRRHHLPVARGGLLLAASLGGRAPPAATPPA